MSTGDLATLIVALATVALATVTYRQVRLTRTSLDLSIRPFLADPRPASTGSASERLLFGAPGRISVDVPSGTLSFQGAGSGAFHLSVPFENIGAGVAAVVAAETAPSLPGDIYVSRKFVPVGEIVRVNISVLTDLPGAERFKDQWWAMDGLDITLRYTDANGQQELASRASIAQYATQSPFIQEIAVFSAGKAEPIATGRGSY